MKEIIDILREHSDGGYAVFSARLAPNVPADRFIGVRVPELRKIAREIGSSDMCGGFLDELPHTYYEENMLHSILLCGIKDHGESIVRVEDFLPYVDNWAVCDTLRPRTFAHHKDEILMKIGEWTSSDRPFTVRFGIEMLLEHFLGSDFRPEYNEIPAAVICDDYYVRMMIAWYYAEALIRQWDSTIGLITGRRLDVWTHNKTITKACESRRITDEQKRYLVTLRA